MFLFTAVTLVVSSASLRELIEFVFAELTVTFQENLGIIVLTTCILSLACLAILMWPSLPKHFAVLGTILLTSLFCFLIWSNRHVLHIFHKTMESISMSMPPSISIAMSTVLGLTSATFATRRRALSMPCPPGLPLVGHALEFIRSTGPTGNSTVDALARFRNKYGGIYLTYLGLSPMVVVSNPELLKQILATKQKSFIKSKEAFSSFTPILGGGLVTLEGKPWKFHRTILNPSFHYSYLQDVAFHIFLKSTMRQIDVLNKLTEASDRQAIDIIEIFRFMTLEIIGKATLSLDTDEDAQTLQNLYGSVISEMNLRFWYPYRAWLPTQSNAQYKSQLRKLDSFLLGVITSRRYEFNRLEQSGSDYPRRDLLDLMMSGQDENGLKLSNDDLLCEVKTFLLAGHETTSMWLAYTFHLLVQPENISAYERVQNECIQVMTDNKGEMQPSDLAKLTYTTYSLKESLRVIPTVPVLMRETVEEVTLGEYAIPKGVKVVIDIWGAHYDEASWGHDVDVFRPDRFDDDAPKPHPFAFLPFSLGSRNCLGQNFAFMEAKIVMAAFMSRFNFAAPLGGHLPMVKYDFPLHPIDGILLYVDKISVRKT